MTLKFYKEHFMKKKQFIAVLIFGIIFSSILVNCENGTTDGNGTSNYSSETLSGTSWINKSLSFVFPNYFEDTRIIKFTSNSTWSYSYTRAISGQSIDPSLSVILNGSYIFKDSIISLKLGERVIITTIFLGSNNNNSITVDGFTYVQESLFP